jgi:hypothetical protein
MKIEHRTNLRIAGIRAPLARRIGHHRLDFLRQGVGVIRQKNHIVVALAHLAAIQARQLRHLGQLRLRLRKNLRAVEMVKTAHHLAAKFDVRHLIDPDRHPMGLVHNNVSRLQQRIAEKAVGIDIAVRHFLLLLTIRRHALQPGQRRDHR